MFKKYFFCHRDEKKTGLFGDLTFICNVKKTQSKFFWVSLVIQDAKTNLKSTCVILRVAVYRGILLNTGCGRATVFTSRLNVHFWSLDFWENKNFNLMFRLDFSTRLLWVITTFSSTIVYSTYSFLKRKYFNWLNVRGDTRWYYSPTHFWALQKKTFN